MYIIKKNKRNFRLSVKYVPIHDLWHRFEPLPPSPNQARGENDRFLLVESVPVPGAVPAVEDDRVPVDIWSGGQLVSLSDSVNSYGSPKYSGTPILNLAMGHEASQENYS
jgi:hypothetical protein